MTLSQALKDRQFRADIEGLRGFAVLLVVLYHCGFRAFRGGYVGVDVFFVISGYLITALIVDEIRAEGNLDFFRFYARRVRRILPAASFVVAVVAVLSAEFYAPWNLQPVLKAGFASSLWAGNIYFVRIALDYLAVSARHSPYLHMWSLGVEEQFYLVWPVLLSLALRREHQSRVLNPFAILGCLTLVSITASGVLTRTHQFWAFFMLPCRAWEFAIGGIAWLYAPQLKARSLITLLGLGSVIASAALFSETTAFPGYSALLPTGGTVLVLISGNGRTRVSSLLENRYMRFLGRYSYSWYLWHWPVLVLVAELDGRLATTQTLSCCLFALILAVATYHAIEKPLRYNPLLVRSSRLTIGLGVLTAVLGAIFCIVVLNLSTHHLNAAERLIATEAEKIPVVYTNGCHLDFEAVVPPPCVFGDQQAARTLVLMGDSHAASLFPAVEQAAVERHWRLISITKSSCPLANVPIYNPTIHRLYSECAQWRENAIRKITSIHPQLLILSDYTTQYISKASGDGNWVAGLRMTLQQFDVAEIDTYLVHDPPAPSSEVVDCLFWKSRLDADPHACTYFPDNKSDLSISALESQAASGLSHIRLMNLNSVVCRRQPCSVYSNGTLIYRDDHHLAVDFSRTLAPSFVPLLTNWGLHR